MDCALEDRDGLGVDLCLGRQLGPLLQNARAQSLLSQSNQATNETRPNRLHTHTHPPKRLAHPFSPIPPLPTLTSRATHAHPT